MYAAIIIKKKKKQSTGEWGKKKGYKRGEHLGKEGGVIKRRKSIFSLSVKNI